MKNNTTPRLVEIVGPAGSGKTTLCRALSRSSDRIFLDNFPHVRSASDAPFFLHNGLQITPGILRSFRSDSQFINRREFAWLTILKGWPAVLQKALSRNNKVIVLDQGPIYLLTETREFGPEHLKSKSIENMWQAFYREWSATLDMIVWLDATDQYLLERINQRDKEHVMKNEPHQTASEFLNRYRTAYESVISTMTANRAGLRVLRFDTGRESPNQIVDQLLVEFGLNNSHQ